MKTCKRCLFHTGMKSITLDSDGICNYCRLHDILEKAYPVSEERLDRIVETIKKKTDGRKYNCLMGISGGCDSSYMLVMAKQKGLNPLAVHFDNGWNTETAEHNITVMTKKLGVDLIRYRAAPVYDDINKAFLKASVSDADIPNDIALLTVVLETANTFGIDHNFSGHDFRSEGSCPTCWTCMDSKYIGDVYQKFMGEPLVGFPLMPLWRQVYWGLQGIKTVRPLYYLDYQKENTKELLKTYGWRDYGKHHCENIYTAFVGTCLLPKKFGIDKRIIDLSAAIRSGRKTREEAETIMATPPETQQSWVDEVVKRYFGGDLKQFDEMMKAQPKTFMDYGDYYSKFRRYKALFWLGMKFNVFPRTFYEKYTREAKIWKRA